MNNASSESICVGLAHNRTYDVVFEPHRLISARMISSGLNPGCVIVITDENVGPLFGPPLENRLKSDGWDVHLITIPAGETSKSIERLSYIYGESLKLKIERNTPILALGGGVVGDIAGLSASTLLRGVPFVQLPTTLLAMVDSSIGGKTGINHPLGKNLIGTFYQPRFVCTDLATLKSLPDQEWLNGLSEVIKHAIISGTDFLDWLAEHFEQILDRDETKTGAMVKQAAFIKAEIVAEDELESGVRAFLNFGHTFGHALESVAGYRSLSHGQAVLVGMKAALALSKIRNPSLDSSVVDKLLAMLPQPAVEDMVRVPELLDAMRFDKKRTSGRIRVVLIRQPGQPYLTADLEDAEIAEAWKVALGAA